MSDATQSLADVPKRKVIRHPGGRVEFQGHRKITIAQYWRELTDAWGEDAKLWKVVCPSCGVAQSLAEMFDVEPKATTADEQNARARLVGFSCIGRLTGATGAFNPARWAPCNYTSGGLLCINSLVVIHENGNESPAFEPAPAPSTLGSPEA